ncbi:MAG: phage antirepressor [Bacteroidales bacterium]|nr:phage antirepressor [Bacteroidales bacterium]
MKGTNQFQIFNHPQFGEVRTVICNDGEPRFCLKDVCRALDIKQFRANERLGEDVISNHTLSTRGGNQQFMFINEDGLYDVILDSRKIEAKKFRKWVTSEVLPSIRKNGAYLTEKTIERALNEPNFLIELATNLKKEKQAREFAEERNEIQKDIIEGQEKAIRVLEVRQSFVDYIMSTPSCVCITQIAKEYGLSAVKLNKFLHEKKIQYCVNGQWLLYADFQDKGYMKSVHVRLENNTSREHS